MTYTFKCPQGHITNRRIEHAKPSETIVCPQCEDTDRLATSKAVGEKKAAFILYYKEP